MLIGRRLAAAALLEVWFGCKDRLLQPWLAKKALSLLSFKVVIEKNFKKQLKPFFCRKVSRELGMPDTPARECTLRVRPVDHTRSQSWKNNNKIIHGWEKKTSCIKRRSQKLILRFRVRIRILFRNSSKAVLHLLKYSMWKIVDLLHFLKKVILEGNQMIVRKKVILTFAKMLNSR
jgi:hypothetical protein